jgi:nickel superoxide dismutase
MDFLLKTLDRLSPPQKIYAHCDIPCGIYDPHEAQVAAHTVIRMTSLIDELPKEDSVEREHNLARYTAVKEEHAEKVKHEIRVLWGDYFKDEHLKAFPHLQEAVFHTMKLASKAKQEINMAAAKDLLEHVQEIAEIFFKTKNVEPIRIKSIYPTEGEIVSHK